MSVTITTGVDFGPGYVGLLSSAGYTVYTLSGTTFNTYLARSVNIAISGSLVATSFSGQAGSIYFVAWDTGGASPVTQWQIVAGQVFQSGDSYALNSNLSGMVLTGSVAGSPNPPPTTSSFTILLDAPSSATANDIIGLYATFRSGAREPSFQKITGCTISSPTLFNLSFNVGYADVPSVGDLVMISG